MGEDYWDRRRRHLNEDHTFRRAQSKRDIEILKGRHRIDEGKDAIDRLAAEIRRRERSEKLKALLDEMQKERAYVLERIAACSSAHKDRWSGRLSGIDLTHPGADAELKNLREEVEGVRRQEVDRGSLYQYFELPEDPEEPPVVRLILGPKRKKLEQSARQYYEDKAIEHKLKLSSLALIVSSLDGLISTRNLYEAP